VCGRTACTDRGGGGRKPAQAAQPHGAGASRRPYIELENRRVHLAGCTTNPTGAWVAQQARNLLLTLDDREQQFRFLIHDRDAKFGGGCDHVFQSEGIAVIRTPVQAPNANAHAKRWVGSVRRECLDRVLIFSRRQLEHVLRVYTRHYNEHRPHRALALCQPEQADGNAKPLRAPPFPQLNRRDLAGSRSSSRRTTWARTPSTSSRRRTTSG
jgi:putative transposase